MKQILTTILVAVVSSLCGVELPENFKESPSGEISFPLHGMKLSLCAFDANWKGYGPGNLQNLKWNQNDFSGNWVIDSVKASCNTTIRKTGAQAFQADIRVETEKPLKLNYFYITLNFPLDSYLEFDGAKMALPESYEKLEIYKYVPVQQTRIYTAGKRLTIDASRKFSQIVTDNRVWNHSQFSIRILLHQISPTVYEASLKFSLDEQKSQMLDIGTLMNRGFADDPSLPVRGWSGQGGGNDLSAMKPQNITYSGVTFHVIDPKKNSGRSVLGLGGKNRLQKIPDEVKIPVPDSFAEYGAINLLHAAAWPAKNIGTMNIQYADGFSETIKIDSESVGNWWEPTGRENGVIVWEGENPEQRIGLFASTFPLKGKKIKSITLSMANDESLWMIPAITFSSFPFSTKSIVNRDVKRVADKKWLPMEFNRCVIPGSPLDLSSFADAPAGKYGWVRISSEGHLYFEKTPEKRVRFFGTNLCFDACSPNHETAEQTAVEIRKCGYNSVRLHHIDNGALLKTDASVSTELDPVKMERFDYLVSQSKKQGLYLTLDFYSSRSLKAGDQVVGNGKGYKALVVINKEARENLKKYIRALMTHKNPYTGLSLAEDPALIGVNLVNEDYITGTWKSTPRTIALFKAGFEKWKTERGIKNQSLDTADPVFYRFLLEQQRDAMLELADYLRNDLKCPVPFTSANAHVDPFGAMLVRNFDFVDNHLYHDHPSYPEKAWSMPSAFRQNSSLESFGRYPLLLGTTRIFGKPFFVTEYNICYPNKYRSECGPVMGALSSLQDWDAIYRFAWSHGKGKIENKNSGIEGFDIVNDPIGLLAERITAMMFLRGDVRPSETKAALEMSENEFLKKDGNFRSNELIKLGLLAQIGRAETGRSEIKFHNRGEITPDKLSDSVLAAKWKNLLNWKKTASSTEEIIFDPKEKTLAVVSPKTESFSFQNGTQKGKIMTVAHPTSFTTVALISLDSKTLSESRNMLLLHLTNVNSSGMIFGSPQMTLLRSTGGAPALVYHGTVEVSLKTEQPLDISALSVDGKILGKIHGNFENGNFRFTADTGCFKGGVMVYHLTR